MITIERKTIATSDRLINDDVSDRNRINNWTKERVIIIGLFLRLRPQLVAYTQSTFILHINQVQKERQLMAIIISTFMRIHYNDMTYQSIWSLDIFASFTSFKNPTDTSDWQTLQCSYCWTSIISENDISNVQIERYNVSTILLVMTNYWTVHL